MGDELRSVLLGTGGLAVAAVASVLIAVTRARPSASAADLRAAARLAGVAVLIQAAHFVEELATGFPARFPEQLGLAPWSRAFFVSFNVFWLAVWALSCRSLVDESRAASATLWLLGIAGLANAIVHPLLAARVGGYFPGLVTSPFLGVAAFSLLRRLAQLTRTDPLASPDPP